MHPSSAAEHRTHKVNNKNILDDVNIKIVITKGIKREVLRYGSKYHILPSAILAMFICCDIHVGHLFKQVRPVSVCSRSFRMLRSRTDNALAFAGFHGLHILSHIISALMLHQYRPVNKSIWEQKKAHTEETEEIVKVPVQIRQIPDWNYSKGRNSQKQKVETWQIPMCNSI